MKLVVPGVVRSIVCREAVCGQSRPAIFLPTANTAVAIPNLQVARRFRLACLTQSGRADCSSGIAIRHPTFSRQSIFSFRYRLRRCQRSLIVRFLCNVLQLLELLALANEFSLKAGNFCVSLYQRRSSVGSAFL